MQELADEIFEEFRHAGRKFYAGSEVAIVDKPEIYILRSDGDVYSDPGEFPEGAIGDGDNVFRPRTSPARSSSSAASPTWTG